jgi:exodeoxyribonuclease V alpha subunit
MEGKTVIEGILERVTYLNEENNYTVAKLQVKWRKELVTIVGNMLSVNPGETLRLRGEWVTNKRFGEEFRVESGISVLPATLTGIEKYLGSGLVKGIGPIMAKRLVDKFGLATLDIIEQNPQRLFEVEGIGPIRAERISRAWEEQKEIREVMVFLQGYGVNTTYAVKIYKQYGDKAISLVKENPYRLAMDISGIGFKTADRIAQNMGIEPSSPIRAEAGIVYLLSELVDEGHVYYPWEKLRKKAAAELGIPETVLDAALETLKQENKVVIKNEEEVKAVYLTPLHVAEDNTARRLKQLLEFPRQLFPIDVDKAIEWVQQVSQIHLAERQKQAIRKAIESKVLVITGGPGTGKTTLINSLIQILARKRQRILLASPTGRAAKRLSEVTGREAKTIHRLLEYSPSEGGFKRNSENPLEADMVIIDEASMIDVLLMNHLLKAIPPSATLILVGDVDQLPSVGPGNVLRDIIASGAVEVVRLTEIFRQALESSIVVNAHRVNHGEFPQTRSVPGKPQDFYFIPREDPEKVLEIIKEMCLRRIPRAFGFDSLNDIQVMTPIHRGVVGVANLNRELQSLLNPEGEEVVYGSRVFRLGDKVMQIKNNYEKEVFNGDIGKIVRIDREEQQVVVRFEDREVTYDWSELDELTLAYAISVHKSQGSEYPAVVVPILPQHYIMLQRNLLYTTITRAKKLLIIIGTKKAIAIAVKNNKVQERYTSLKERLRT